MPRRFEPDSGRGQAAKRFKVDQIRRDFLFRLAFLGPLQTTIAPPTALRAPCLGQGALDEVQAARSRGTGPAGRALSRLARRQDGFERLASALPLSSFSLHAVDRAHAAHTNEMVQTNRRVADEEPSASLPSSPTARTSSSGSQAHPLTVPPPAADDLVAHESSESPWYQKPSPWRRRHQRL